MNKFNEYAEKAGQPVVRREISLLQVNMGYRCNLKCSHCHIEAGPDRTETMGMAVIEDCLGFVKRAQVRDVDITGGAPETNPNLPDFIRRLRQIKSVERILIRTNLAILDTPEHAHLPDFFAANRVELIASMPCYLEENVDSQRGKGVHARNIAVLQKLNRLGYGAGRSKLHLVYNPGGDFLPGPQSELEAAYKENLGKEFGITFDSLFTITNTPIGRFRTQLEEQGQLNSYTKLLIDNFNPLNLANVMCRNMVSVDWKGQLFDCDFNQPLGLPTAVADNYIGRVEPADLIGRAIATGEHCFSCVAGTGSSCQGSLEQKAG